MSNTVAALAARKGRLPALVASLAIFGWLTVTDAVQLLINIGWLAAQGPVEPQSAGGGYIAPTADFWASFARAELAHTLPFCIGVFVCLWAIAPISHELRAPYVVTRGGLAAFAGAALAGVVAIVIGFVSALPISVTPFGNSFFDGGFDGALFLSTTVGSLIGIITQAMAVFPLVALAAVLLWVWLREHPREYEIAGLIDEL